MKMCGGEDVYLHLFLNSNLQDMLAHIY